MAPMRYPYEGDLVLDCLLVRDDARHNVKIVALTQARPRHLDCMRRLTNPDPVTFQYLSYDAKSWCKRASQNQLRKLDGCPMRQLEFRPIKADYVLTNTARVKGDD